MRFDRLQIPAFGPFTNLALALPKEPVDFHVVYGPNEAGKSSLLRALRDLLFGIHGQSADNFRHAYGDLRIAAEITNRAGDRLAFTRRKGNRNTLLDQVGQPLPDHALAPFLGGMDQTCFSTMFGLGATELRDGAVQLLRGEGDMGKALFSASLGGTPVQHVLEGLREQADRLYKPRATVNVRIRPMVHRYKELLRESRDAMVAPEAWEAVEKDLADAERQKTGLESQITNLDQELARIERWEAALPIILRLNEATDQLRQLPPTPELPTDFSARAQAARTALQTGQGKEKGLGERLGKLQEQLLAYPESEAVLNHAEALEQLRGDLGAYRENCAKVQKLKQDIAGLESLLRSGMAKLELVGEFDALASARLSSPARLACEEAAKQLQTALAEQGANTAKISELAHQIREHETELQSLQETSLKELREALTLAEDAIEADRSFRKTQSELQRLKRETLATHRQLVGAPEDLSATANLPVPAQATLDRFKDRIDQLRRDFATQQGKAADAQARLESGRAELARLQRQRALPSEEDLRQARRHRDHGWSLVLAQWKGSGTSQALDPELPLEQAFPKAIQKADELVDLLRRDAESVAQAEEKRFQIVETEKQSAAAALEIARVQSELEECLKAWQSEWDACAITARSPAEMVEWRGNWREFKESFAKLQTAEEVASAKAVQIAQRRKALAAALGESEAKEFSVLFEAAKEQVRTGEQRSGRRAELDRQLTRCRAELKKLEERREELGSKVSAAASEWAARCSAARLPDTIGPENGLVLLRERHELLGHFERWQELSKQLQTLTERISDFEQGVAKHARALGVGGESTYTQESALWTALGEARSRQAKRQKLAEQIGQAEEELAQARLGVTQLERAFQELLATAQLHDPGELEGFLSRLEQRQNLQALIQEQRSNLVGLARSPAVDNFIQEVCAQATSDLLERKARAAGEKAELTTKLLPERERIFELASRKRELEKAGDTAARLRQEAELCAATLREDAGRYLRLRLAIAFLEAQIQRFREENQGPMLKRSGELFSAITRGAFAGLTAEVNADDVPVLVALRPDSSQVRVEGLSDGSRDQLYLALRLAALEQHVQQHEPMPLILDDLLITFDNARSAAILPTLAELGQRTQIFLFTHHEHLVELCRGTLGDGRFHLHTLTPA